MTLASAQWPAIGTTALVVVTDLAHLDAAQHIVVDELAQLDLACSRFRDDSEIARLAARGNAWTPVSEVLADVLRCALDVARVTDGDVDPTMGTDLCRLGYDRDFSELKKASALGSDQAVLPLTYRLVYRTTWHDVEFDHARRRVRVPAGLVLDLGAIAKAWCADRCAARIHRELGVGVLVSLGGDIATAGTGPDGGWVVRVQDSAGRRQRPERRRRATRRICGRDVEHDHSHVAARRVPASSHTRPRHSTSGRADLANRDCRRQHLRRRQRGNHRGDCSRPRRATLAGHSPSGRPPCRP